MAINTLGFCKAVVHKLTLGNALRSLPGRHYVITVTFFSKLFDVSYTESNDVAGLHEKILY